MKYTVLLGEEKRLWFKLLGCLRIQDSTGKRLKINKKQQYYYYSMSTCNHRKNRQKVRYDTWAQSTSETILTCPLCSTSLICQSCRLTQQLSIISEQYGQDFQSQWTNGNSPLSFWKAGFRVANLSYETRLNSSSSLTTTSGLPRKDKIIKLKLIPNTFETYSLVRIIFKYCHRNTTQWCATLITLWRENLLKQPNIS